MLTEFCVAFSTVCFTLLGLWIIVVQTRHGEWRHSPVHRRRAYGVALHFSLPGLMSLLSLVDPASTALWRISFAIVGAGGVIALALVRGPAPTGLGAATYVAAVVLHVLIALVAVAPGMVAEIGVLALPLRVEAVLLTMLVFLGVNVAWLLLFDEASPPSGLEDLTRPRAWRHAWLAPAPLSRLLAPGGSPGRNRRLASRAGLTIARRPLGRTERRQPGAGPPTAAALPVVADILLAAPGQGKAPSHPLCG
jgi:hypothetical protein